MKRQGHLYEKVYAYDNLLLAHQNASKGKGWYEEVKIVNKDVDSYLFDLQTKLIYQTYETSEYIKFCKQEGPKLREIYKLPYFPDRIAQWALIQVIGPILEKHFIRDTFSAIPKRGIHDGLKRVHEAMLYDRENCMFCLKLDLRHYYLNINHEILESQYACLFKDEELLWFINEIIESINTISFDDEWELAELDLDFVEETGIPIGNYFSQYSGNFYLSIFDHWIKEVLYVKHYYRYMDDIVIFARTKEELHFILNASKEFLWENLRMRIKDSWQIFPSFVRGVDFLGYRIFDGYILLRKSTALRMKRKLIAIYEKVSCGNLMSYSDYCCINSYKGWTKYGDCFRLEGKYIKPLEKHAQIFHDTVLVA